MMDGRARNLDIFKTIVLLILILLLFLFLRFFYATPAQNGSVVAIPQVESQPAAPLEAVPTIAPLASPAAAESTAGAAAATAIPAASTIQDCPLAAPARISGVGARVKVINALIPLRTRPLIPSSYFGPLPIGAELEVISLPVCEPYLEGANLWWQVRTPDGRTGWAAEASAIRPVLYYLQEIN